MTGSSSEERALRTVLMLLLVVGVVSGAHLTTTSLQTQRVTLGSGEVVGYDNVTVDRYSLSFGGNKENATKIQISVTNHKGSDVSLNLHAAVKNGTTTVRTTSGTMTVQANNNNNKDLQFDPDVPVTEFDTVEVTVEKA